MRRRKIKANHQLHNTPAITLEISDLSRGGAGFGKDEKNRAVFVPYTMPGDIVKTKLHKAKSKFAEGDIVELIQPAEERIEPRCSVFTRCGGCQWQHIPYETQWKTKKEGVLTSLRLNKIPPPDLFDEFSAKEHWHYRNRIQLRGKNDSIGFFASKTNELIEIDTCAIAHKDINVQLDKIRAEGKKYPKGYKCEVYLTDDHQVKVIWNDEHASTGFRQVNDMQNKNLISWIKENMVEGQGLLDLYGGSGNLSNPFINYSPEIHCVDAHTPNVHPIEHFTFHQSKVLPWLEKEVNSKSLSHRENWSAIIDPPRDGFSNEGEKIISYLNKLNVTRVIFVGCKTDPWSRDVAEFIKQGWKLEKVAILDFFPQTYHVESVALLSRKIKKRLK